LRITSVQRAALQKTTKASAEEGAVEPSSCMQAHPKKYSPTLPAERSLPVHELKAMAKQGI